MEAPTGKRGIIYCRVSSLEQVDGTSLGSQERMCREFAARQGIEVLETFIEKGESAKTANRTEFNKAILFCQKKGSVNFFIVAKFDRFARNSLDHGITKAKLKSFGTELVSITEPITNNPAGNLMETILSGFAQFDNEVRTERTRNGMYERAKQGIWVWRAPIGYYRPEPKSNIVIDPVNASFVRTIFEEYAKGIYTYKSLAKHLADRGFRTRTGHKPIQQLIEKILKNPIYYGVIKVWDEEHRGAFDPIISRQLYDDCQGRRKKPNNSPRTAKNPVFPLRRLIVCSECSKSLTGSRSTGRSGRKYFYYHHHGQGCPNAKFLPKEDFEQSFSEYLNEITPDKKYEVAFKAIVLDIWKTNYKKLDEDNARVRREMEKLEAERQKVFELHRSGVYSDTDFIYQKSVINQQINQKYSLANENRVEEFNMEEALSYAFDFVRNTTKKWLAFEYPERVRFQKMIFDGNVDFDGKKFGNGKLSLIYKGNQEYQAENSKLVTLPGIEPGFRA